MASEEVEKKDRPFRLFSMREENVDSMFTPWTLVHALSGAASKAVGMSFSTNFMVHAVYEVKDLMSQDEVYNSAVNSIGDQFASMAGHSIANKGQTTWVWLWFIVYAAAIATGNELG
jgi:hypothetical protein